MNLILLEIVFGLSLTALSISIVMLLRMFKQVWLFKKKEDMITRERIDEKKGNLTQNKSVTLYKEKYGSP